eukprot:CAMPEP_0206271164 /NCGR_PEP_ID=MMETSP0047_2-20121206/33278_1 /ASSEMBLY_ACC=CAM_ASM_000192 /TAXON_ID=195065 /ORGANISM="Chroomonas mesostigmatica_cf, Strain CCMP1168" /LENGTH=53 /DNA_ID=CAMNT_0053699899 /DNA_START=158 /DNA_END=319 /DNA_ORIENTATION=-
MWSTSKGAGNLNTDGSNMHLFQCILDQGVVPDDLLVCASPPDLSCHRLAYLLG